MSDQPHLTVTADDFGFSRGATDTILETVDHGVVSNVSIMANGEAFEYALEKQIERKDRLALSIHFNLTEGPTVARSRDVPLLADADGMFKHTVIGLWLAYLFAPDRAAFRAQVRLELEAQRARVVSALNGRGTIFSVNGHQHVHMLPFVQQQLALMPEMPPVRVPKEPLYAGSVGDLPFLVLRFPGWLMLSFLCNTGLLHALSDSFVGVLYSGRMTDARVQAGLTRVHELKSSSVELLLHPGSVESGEVARWKRYAGYLWHFSKWRARERNLLLDTGFQKMLNEGTYSSKLPGILLRFIVVGSLAAAVHLVLTYTLTEAAGFWYVGSSVIGWIAGFFVSFALQKFWTFGDHNVALAPRQAVRYFILQGTNLTLNAAGVFFLTDVIGVWYLAAQCAVLIMVAAFTFVISRRFIFASRS